MARVSIEDCQKKLSNRFALAMTAAHRARQLLNNAEPLVDANNREAVLALREIAEGLVTMKVEEQVEDEEAEEIKKTEEVDAADASVQESESAAVAEEASSSDQPSDSESSGGDTKSQSESSDESSED